MARAYASIILNAPVEAVWPLVRDFNACQNGRPPSPIQDRGRAGCRCGGLRALLPHP
jgi:hypothetical protein